MMQQKLMEQKKRYNDPVEIVIDQPKRSPTFMKQKNG
jgi:hypothetical protein